LLTTISYYRQHREGGVVQTLLAVANSFSQVAEAYQGEDSVFAKMESYDLENQVLEAFENMEEDTEETPYSSVFRLHVRANSDSQEDQELKMAVKEDVVALLTPLLSSCDSAAESKQVVVSELNSIYETAVNAITEQGYDYSVKVYVTEEEFPAKTYGDVTFPEGTYQALRIDIGEAAGQNWWCVLYPPLCFIDESTAVVSAEGKEMLKEALTPEEYEALFTTQEVTGKSYFLQWIKERIRQGQ
jgi:stage II sporulation protein R